MSHSVIDKNILNVYLDCNGEDTKSSINCMNLWWDKKTIHDGHINKLSELCITTIADNWMNNPVKALGLEGDTNRLLEKLSLKTLPLSLLVRRVPHEIYWQETFQRTYQSSVPANVPALMAFLERHTAEYLEGLQPKDYDPQQISELVSMCGQVLKKLHIKKLTAGSILPRTSSISDNKNTANKLHPCYRDTIPLGSVLSGLTKLTELSLSLGMSSPEGGFSKELRKISPPQLAKIVQGITHCVQLQILRITRSDIDCDKMSILLEGLNDLEQLRTLNLGHCHIGDKGALALSNFLLQKSSCKELVLVNNKIGSLGAEGLAYALCQPILCRLLTLDLSCNTTLGVKGVKMILTALLRGTLLNKLIISACGVSGENDGIEVGGVLAAGLAAGRTPLRELDISNNHLGEDSGGALLAALETCGSSGPTVLCARSCGLGRWEAALQRATLRTAARRRAAQLRFRGGARRLLQAKRIARAIGIDDEVDPLQLARQLTARPSAASLPLSLTLSLSLSQDALLYDLPSSAREILNIEIPPLKNPMCPTPQEETRQRRFTLSSYGQSELTPSQRRYSEPIQKETAPSLPKPSTTNISIHFKAVH